MEEFKLLMDHKPLTLILALYETPIQCQRLLMQLRRYNLKAEHMPGKKLIISDTLSRHPIQDENSTTVNDVKSFMDNILTLPASDKIEQVKIGNDMIWKEVIDLKKEWSIKEWAIKENINLILKIQKSIVSTKRLTFLLGQKSYHGNGETQNVKSHIQWSFRPK